MTAASAASSEISRAAVAPGATAPAAAAQLSLNPQSHSAHADGGGGNVDAVAKTTWRSATGPAQGSTATTTWWAWSRSATAAKHLGSSASTRSVDSSKSPSSSSPSSHASATLSAFAAMAAFASSPSVASLSTPATVTSRQSGSGGQPPNSSRASDSNLQSATRHPSRITIAPFATTPSISSTSSNPNVDATNTRDGALSQPNDPSPTGFDPSASRWANLFKIFSGQVTPEGILHFREQQDRLNEEKDCKRCEASVKWLIRNSPVVNFLAEKTFALIDDSSEVAAAAAAGGVPDGRKALPADSRAEPESWIMCRRCPARLTEDGKIYRQAGGFSPGHGILLCANDVKDRGVLEDTLAHELVHAWDHLRWKVDFVGEVPDVGLRQAACTEIRASMLSGECRWTREFFTRGNFRLTMQFQNCVRGRAVLSLMARPRCTDEEHARQVVDDVWDSCFRDKRPFDEVYK